MRYKFIIYGLLVAFIVVELSIFLPDYESPRIIKFIILTQILFALSIGIWWIGRRFDFENADRKLFYTILVFALIARAIMLIGAGDHFYLSDDVYRYIWDGKVNASGVNPFLYAPDDAELAHLTDETIHPYINHPWHVTIYPPLAQSIFSVSWIIGGDGTFVFKIICALFELLACLALLRWLTVINVSRNNALLYIFSPLILVEFYLSSHLDILALPLLIAALIALRHQKALLTGILLALAGMIKFFGLFFSPFIFFYFKGKDRLKFAGGLVATIILMYLPYAFGSDWKFLGSLFTYLETWQFNGSVFIVLKQLFEMETARNICGVLFVLWNVFLLVKKEDVHQKCFKSFAGYLILTPVFFPWYYVWIFPFVVRNLSPSFIFLSSATILSYDVFIAFYDVGYWEEVWWMRALIYVPFYIMLLYFPFKQMITRIERG